MGNPGQAIASRAVKYVFAGMIGLLPLAICGTASAAPSSAPAHIAGVTDLDGYVSKVYDDHHSRWRSHRRHGSEGDHGRWHSHRRWGSVFEHNRWRSDGRHGGGHDDHSRSRSHHRHGSGY